MEQIHKQQYKLQLSGIALLLLVLSGCSSTIKDIDGNKYNTVTIGKQVWMSENLKTTKFNDGTDIPNITNNDSWAKLTTPGYSWYFNDEKANKNTYGALYNWYSVSSDKLCPTGWHVPTEADWKVIAIDMNEKINTGGKLKEKGTSHWKSPNIAATNETGFTALPGGYRSIDGVFNFLGLSGYWWSSTKYNESTIIFCYLRFKSDFCYRYHSEKTCGFSVRCIKNN